MSRPIVALFDARVARPPLARRSRRRRRLRRPEFSPAGAAVPIGHMVREAPTLANRRASHSSGGFWKSVAARRGSAEILPASAANWRRTVGTR